MTMRKMMMISATASALAFATPAWADRCDLNGTNGGNNAADANGGATDTGGSSLACGLSAGADDQRTTAIGAAAKATADSATAVGQTATASGTQSTAIGRASTAIGRASTANGANATALGSSSLANGQGSVGIGFDAQDNRLNAIDVLNTTQNNRLSSVESVVGGLGATVEVNRRQADGGIAAAMAMGGAVIVPGSKLSLNFNLATYRGQQGFSLSVAGQIGKKTCITGGVAGSTIKGSTGARVGLAIGL